jgi:hypothetical protein
MKHMKSDKARLDREPLYREIDTARREQDREGRGSNRHRRPDKVRNAATGG